MSRPRPVDDELVADELRRLERDKTWQRDRQQILNTIEVALGDTNYPFERTLPFRFFGRT